MTIVVGYVPTPEGEAALTQAIAEARNRNSRLLVINSSRGDAPVDNRFAHEGDIQSIEERLATQGIDHEIKQPVRGHDAAAEVLDAAEEHEAELIVIGLRRRTPVGKLIMGSTSQRVLLEADCPVLAVKAG
ncbi:nucleotide-binding universal stress UspA family protein [Arthrobacter ulcerisalmonis]|uniref:universal stress protein n=1 Tax=Arthrobacter sp. B1I2 TaxID=3042263 RepID=UPI00277F5EB2|nr:MULTISPECIES: universal stress protein [Arthrobacter]MDQ0661773.1 nucleotide-binding universal stress UspA family protein [Arthrobacter ulcerisalmonis]MDQ0729688.1 nucleotide-binding universal stress UspA family protein [Arthrobacter sp. B1I2]